MNADTRQLHHAETATAAVRRTDPSHSIASIDTGTVAMDSDDSDASEVASEAGDFYEDSFVADEIIEEDTDHVRPTRRPASTTTTNPRTGPGPSTTFTTSSRLQTNTFGTTAAKVTLAAPVDDDVQSNPYADDDYEAEDADYSVDFEEEADVSPGKQPKRSLLPSPSSPTGRMSPQRRPPAIAEDAEYAYSGASFEEVSQSQQSISTNRLVVDLSVPVRRDSTGSTSSASGGGIGGGGGGSSPLGKTHANPKNSPNVNLKVLSKPTALSVSPSSAFTPHVAPPPAPLATAPLVVTADLVRLLEAESDKSLSLLLRKVESKYQDELEELREKNALLAWKERELKTELRICKEEKKMRKSQLEKKRRRAMGRRKETETLVDTLRSQNEELLEKLRSAQQLHDQHETTHASLKALVEQCECERRRVEARNLTLAETLQHTLSDFHALNLKYEAAVSAKLEEQRRSEELLSRHGVETQVLEHKLRVHVEAIQHTLEMERASWQHERESLPESYRAMVENERQRIEKLEQQLTQRMREMETQLAKETVRFEKELASAWATTRCTEEKADKRLQAELLKISRERDALDEQRRELLMGMTKSSSRSDEERGRLDATREQLEVQRRKLVEERAEIDARAAYVEERVHRLVQQESVLEARRQELLKLGRETYDKSKLLAQRQSVFTELQKEMETLRASHQELVQQAAHHEELHVQLEQDKRTLEATARQLQHERLLVAKQRMQSRHFLDGAKKLELLLHQQKALEHVDRGGGNSAATSS